MSIWKNFIAVVLWIVVLVAISCCIFFFEVISGDIVPNGVLPVATPAPVESVVPVAIVIFRGAELNQKQENQDVNN